MPFKYGEGQEGRFDDCVKYYMNRTSKRTGKKYTEEEASAVCAAIARKQEKLEAPKFTLSVHQLGNEKHFDLFLQKDGFCEDWAFLPFKAAEKMILKMGTRCQKRTNVPEELMNFTGTIPIGKPGATHNFPGIFKKLEEGTYEVLEESGKIRRFKFNGKKLVGTFEMVYDDADLVENYKYRYIFNRTSSEDMQINHLLKEIKELSKFEKTVETLTIKEPIRTIGELRGDSVIPLRIKGVALKEGIWNGLFYPYEEMKRKANDLIGKPLMTDHSKSVRDIAGKIVGIELDDINRQVLFEADVIDEDTARKLIENLVDSVSVGVIVDRIKEGKGLTARNYDFKELSLVLIPACRDAKIKEIIKPN
jgi:hypothetical protein